MRVPRTIYAITLSLVAGLMVVAQPAEAKRAKTLNDAQLTLLFSGSKVEATGECYGGYYNGELISDFVFNTDGSFSAESACHTSKGTLSVSDAGKWWVEDDEFCMGPIKATPGGVGLNRYLRSDDPCFPVRQGKYGFGFYEGKSEFWKLSVSHPKFTTKEKLLAALDGLSNKTVAKIDARTVSEVAKDSAAWEKIRYSNRVSDFQRYLEEFPGGMFVALAESQMRDMIKRQTDPKAVKNLFAGIDFGAYHALVIGIDDYKYLPKLKTAATDARSVASMLEKNYGFKVSLLIDPERADIIDVLDEYRETLGAKDNLLIYYAGHGWLDEESDEGYWLTRSAKPNRRSHWVSNAAITNTLKVLSAKHVMVVADSCYSGTLTRSASAVGFRDKEYYKRMAAKQARVALVSGGLEPVADKGGEGNSPFATAFLDALRANADVIDGTRLFSEIRRPVILNAKQTPQYSDVRHAGHDGGDFLFVRKK